MMTDTTGERLPGVNAQWGMRLAREQMGALARSGLSDAAEEIHVGVNGGVSDCAFVRSIVPRGSIYCWGGEDIPATRGLLPTMRLLQGWLTNHQHYDVLFFHAKGATHPEGQIETAWRNCMTWHTIFNWRQCVQLLKSNDAVGCHWINPGKRDDPDLPQPKFFGGVFWWATAKYLLTLPGLPTAIDKREDWYEPEWWIGWGNPKVVDLHPGMPGQSCIRSARGL